MTVLETDPAPVSPVVELAHEGAQPQRRPSVGFRAILLIPHWIWLSLVGFAAMFAVVGIWFGALFTGRAPHGLRNFVGGYARYYTRVLAYGYLLTDQFPSFALEPDDDYPVELVLPPSGRLNRAAVFFRYFLLIPAGILAGLVGAGLGFALFFIWLIVLVKGRMPRSLHEAIAAVLRYTMRLTAFGYMLTSEYPHRLYGDKPTPTDADGTPVDDETLLTAPPPTDQPVAELPGPARTTRLLLGKAAKRLVTLFIVLSVVSYAGFFTVAVVAGVQGNEAANRLRDEHAVLEVAVNDFVSTTQTCGISGGPDCVHGADHDFAEALTRFRAELRDISYPRNVVPLASDVEDDATALIDLLHELEQTEDVTAYQQLAAQFQGLANQFDSDYQDLYFTLRFN
ncbi:MAG: rane protein [Actinomycetia bacterium]|nr:rane protein [Actinomycetes bacterium]